MPNPLSSPPPSPGGPPRMAWWKYELYWLVLIVAGLGVVWLMGRRPKAHVHPAASHGPGPAVSLILGLAAVLVLAWLWHAGRPAPGKVLGSRGTLFRTDVRLSLRASTMHMWILGPIGSGKTTLLCNLILGELRAVPDIHVTGLRHRRKRRREAAKRMGPGRGVAAVDPNGAMVNRLRSRCSPEEWARVTIIDPADPNCPPIDLLAASDREQAADFFLSLFRALPGGGTVGIVQLDILRRGILSLPKGSTLIDLPRHLQAITGESEKREVKGLVARLNQFLTPSVAAVVGRQETDNVFTAVDSGRTVILRLRAELSEEASAALAAVFLARLSDRLQRREPDAPARHVTVILDELGGLVRESRVLTKMLDQFRSRNVSVVCAHQRLSQLTDGVVNALKGSALTRIVFRVADADEAAHMAKHLAEPVTAGMLMRLPDYRAAIRRRAKGRAIVVRMLDVPKPYRPPLPHRLRGRVAPLRSRLKGLRGGLGRGRAPSLGAVGVPTDAQVTQTPPGVRTSRRQSRGGIPARFRSTRVLQMPSAHQPPVPPVALPAAPAPLDAPAAPIRPEPACLPSVPGFRPTPRDVDICMLIGEHGVATTHQLAAAFWQGKSDRAPQLRLRSMVDAGVLQLLGPNGRPDAHYGLTPSTASALGRIGGVRRLEDRALPHRLAVVDFGTALMGKAPAEGWELRWDSEAALRRDPAIPDHLVPDSRITLTGPGGRLTAWVEVDRGTEGWNWLGPKLQRLADHGGADALLVAFESPGRAAKAHGRLPAADGLAVAGCLLGDHIRDPFGSIWTPAGGGDKLALGEMACRESVLDS